MDWVAFIKHAPPRLAVPRIRGTAGAIFGFRVRATVSKTLLKMTHSTSKLVTRNPSGIIEV